MRPNRLVMSAFANYAQEQEIDFTKLENRNMFLVTGNTGAGKTTIFDAISYVLFGDASGDGRTSNNLISDYSDGSIETFVELEFELKGDIYKVRRRPQQSLNKKRGEGKTTVSAYAELTMPNGADPITGANPVTSKIEELLGINSNQFRQIVMLPQGEFMKFLKASSKDKKNIFRDIFGTSEFNKVQEKLKEKSYSLKGELKEYTTARDVHVKNIKAEDNSILESKRLEENYDVDMVLELTQNFVESDLKNSEVKNKEILEIKESNKKYVDSLAKLEENQKIISEYKLVKSKYDEKVLEVDKFKQLKLESINAKKAQNIQVIENDLTRAKKDKDIKKSEFEKCLEKEQQLNRRILDVKKEFDDEKAKDNERNTLRIDIDNLSKMYEQVRDYDLKKNELLKARKRYAMLADNIKKLDSNLEESEKSKVELENFISKIKDLLIEQNNLEIEGKNKKQKVLKAEAIKQKFDELKKVRQNHSTQMLEYNDIKISEKKAREEYENGKTLYMESLAGILSEELKENQPCPVCGSLEHPSKAVKLNEAPTKEELEELEKNKAVQEKKLNDIWTKLENLKVKADNIYEGINFDIKLEFKELLSDNFESLLEDEKMKFVYDLAEKLRLEISAISKEYIAVKNQTAKLEDKQKELDSLVLKIQEIKLSLEQANNNKIELRELGAKLSANVSNIEEQIPEDLRSEVLLNSKKLELSKKLEELIRTYEKAEKNLKEISEDIAKNNQAVELNKKDLAQRELEVSKLEDDFKNELEAYGLDLETYESFKLSIREIESLDKSIEEFNNTFNTLRGSLMSIEKQFEVLEVKELDDVNAKILEITNSIKELSEKEKILQDEASSFKHRADINSQCIEKIVKVNEKIKNKEKKYKDIDHLYLIATGKGGNAKKMDFETYILTSYFEEIIKQANVGLSKMTNGRFEIRRSEEVSGNGTKGLDLNVIDNNTGKERGISSLSGGESFKAALAIALALAQVIQNSSGGVSIETMFIDEGFGTLDPSSLDTAIKCLLDLQDSGRLVGVISHVQELKESIDVRLEVTVRKDNKGSKAEFVIE